MKLKNRPTVLQELQNELIMVLNRYDLPVSSKFSVLMATAVMQGLKEQSRYQVAQALRRAASLEEQRGSAGRVQ